jgi:hypothetical protein
MSQESRKSAERLRERVHQRIAEIRQQISALDYACSGTLLHRTKVCGKPSCRCAQDPNARHGPYYEWNRREQGRLVHRVVSPEQAEIIRRAISNYRTIQRLLRKWDRETTRIVEAKNQRIR